MKKLTLEEVERLDDLYDTEAYKAILRLLNNIVKLQAQSVLNYNLKEGNAEKLAYLQSQCDGARKVVSSLESFMKRRHKKSVSGVRRFNQSIN